MLEGNENYIRVWKRPDVALVEPHTHEVFELVYIRHGKGIMSIHGKDIVVQKGDLLFYDRNTMHCLNKVETLDAVNITINPRMFGHTEETANHLTDILALTWFQTLDVSDSEFKAHVHYNQDDQLRISQIIEAMLMEASSKKDGYERMLFGYVNILFTMLFRQLKTENGISIRQDMPAILDKVIAYIEGNYSKRITLSDLAKECFYQPSYFSAVFKECYGVSPIKYVNRRRIERAMSELIHTQDSIESIMTAVGIYDKKHFYSLFREVTGLTPADYRKKHKNDQLSNQ